MCIRDSPVGDQVSRLQLLEFVEQAATADEALVPVRPRRCLWYFVGGQSDPLRVEQKFARLGVDQACGVLRGESTSSDRKLGAVVGRDAERH
eukprot:510038-Pyramimonas_sp.AAC.1